MAIPTELDIPVEALVNLYTTTTGIILVYRPLTFSISGQLEKLPSAN